MKPAPYPSTDAAEQDSIAVLESLVDSRFVKTDIRKRDKVPNIDGSIEIVDKEGVPSGKFEIQLRTIKTGKKTYSCPVELLAYSEVCTSPVLLICADRSKKKAYWRQITPTMPEYKEGQKTFTIRFSEISDSIDRDSTYLQSWKDIAQDYQHRIAAYPELRATLGDKLPLKAEPRTIKAFQLLADRINGMFDGDFLAVKKLVFPDVWKFGIGLITSDYGNLSYQIYKIPYGDSTPLLCCLESENLMASMRRTDTAFGGSAVTRCISSPEQVGTSFVLGRVKKVIEQRALAVHGRMLASDVIIAFIDEYHRCTGLTPGLNSYPVDQVEYALNRHFPRVCAAAASGYNREGDPREVVMDLETISHRLTSNRVMTSRAGDADIQVLVQSTKVSVRSVFEAIRYLMSEGVERVDRVFIKEDRHSSVSRGWPWSGFPQELEVDNVKRILTGLLDEYSTFVTGNRLKLHESPYLSTDITIVFIYMPANLHEDGQNPYIFQYHVRDPRSELTGKSVFTAQEASGAIDVKNLPIIRIFGDEYEVLSDSWEDASFFYCRTPVLNMAYRLLRYDLKRHYDIDINIRSGDSGRPRYHSKYNSFSIYDPTIEPQEN